MNAKQVHEAAHAERPDLAYATVLRHLQIMQGKGILTRDESQRSHVYAPSQEQDSLQTNLLKDLIQKAFAGSGKALVLAALRGHVSAAERTEEDAVPCRKKEIMIATDIMTRSMSEVLGWPLPISSGRALDRQYQRYSVCAMPQCPPAFTLSDCLYRHAAVPAAASAEHNPTMAGTSNAQSGGGITTGNKHSHRSGSGVDERKRFKLRESAPVCP